MTGKLIPDCPVCKDFAAQPRATGRATVFTHQGVCHAVPSIWLAGRTMTLGEDFRAALNAWAWHCSVELTRGAVA